MQTIMRDTPIHLQWIPAHTNITGNEKVDTVAKKTTGWKRAKRRNEKWRGWDFGYTAERHTLGRAIKLALEQKTLELWEKACSSEKTGRELHAICPKPTKKRLKIHTKS